MENNKEFKIKKAIIPVAGLGTRFLPFTKTTPKEMLPIINKPTIDYIVKEAVESGIEEIIFITSSTKESLINYFDRNYDLERQLKNKGKPALAEEIADLAKRAKIVVVRQHSALGLGHAVLQAKTIVGDEPFALMLGDDVIYNEDKPVLKQLIEQAENNKSSVLGVGEVPINEVSNYGIVEPLGNIESSTFMLKGLVEKPKQQDAPSRYSIMGRYILSPQIFKFLEEKNIDQATGEIQITDSILKLLNNEKVYAHIFEGIRYDMGSHLGFLKANIEYGLRDEKLRKDLIEIFEKHNNK